MATPAARTQQGPDDVDEAALLAGLRAGDEAAYEQLIRTYGGRMLAVTRRILGNRDDAQDALQEAFLSAFRSIDRFNERARLSTWLHRIAVNAALMRVRRLSRRREISTEDAQPSFTERGHFAEPQAPWSQSVEAEVERGEDRRVVHEAIARLPDNYREALLLRDIEQLTNEEMAAELGVTVNAAKIRVHRARQALRELLHPHMSEAS